MRRIVLGLKLNPFHDTGAAIVADDGDRVRVVAISEERLDRTKNSRAFPAKAIAYCLEAIGCELKDLSLVVADFIGKPEAHNQDRSAGFTPGEAKAEFFRRSRRVGCGLSWPSTICVMRRRRTSRPRGGMRRRS